MTAPRRALWLAVCATIVATCTAAAFGAASPDVRHGRVLKTHLASAAVGDSARTVRVYLPPSYDDADAATRRYPVVYVLHGWPGSDGNMLEFGHVNDTADSLIARGGIPEIIMVFPNGAGTGLLGRSYWIDSYDGRRKLEQFVAHDLVHWTDAHYRTQPVAAARAIVGLSEGGDAAVNIAFKHPDVFSACGGHSGDYVLEPGLGTSAFLGPEPGAAQLLRDNSPALYVARIAPQLKAAGMRVYLDCGTSDESIGHSREFDRELTRLGIAHEFHEFPGSHTWGFWGRHFRESLLAVAGPLR